MGAIPMQAYTDAVEELLTVDAIWNPFQLVYVTSGGTVVNQWQGFIHSMQLVGLAILVLMVALKFIKIYLDELNHIPALTTIFGIAVEMVLVTVFLFNYTWFAEIFPSLFHKMTRAILEAYDATLMDQVLASLRAVGEEKASETKWYSLNAMLASIPSILSTIAAGLALALYWVMSKYQALLYTFWYLIGPLLLPFYLFPPFRGVAERWFASLLGASFMGVVGAILFVLLSKAQWLTKAFSAGVNTSYITALVFALLTLLLMISIPRLSNSIWEGVSTSMTQAMATAGFIGGAATTAAVGGLGAAGCAAGSSVRTGTGMAGVIHRYATQRNTEMPMGKRVLDAIRNRDSFGAPGREKSRGEKLMAGAHSVGGMVKDLGYDLLMSQMPSAVQRAERRLSKGAAPKARKKEEGAVRDYVADKLGADTARSMPFPDRWRLPQKAGEPFETAVKRCAEDFIRTRKVMDQGSAVEKEARRILGDEKAQEFKMPEHFRLKARRGQSDAEAISLAAVGLLKTQKLLAGDTKKRHDQEAILKECVRLVGGEKAKSVQMPSDWAILPKKGQSMKEATHGAAMVLLQRQGLIDKKDENKIALRYRYALAKKRNQVKTANPKGQAEKQKPKERRKK